MTRSEKEAILIKSEIDTIFKNSIKAVKREIFSLQEDCVDDKHLARRINVLKSQLVRFKRDRKYIKKNLK